MKEEEPCPSFFVQAHRFLSHRQAAQVEKITSTRRLVVSTFIKVSAQARQSHPFLPAYLVALAAGLARPGAPLLLRDVPTFLASFSNTSSSRARPSPRYRRRPAILQQHKHSPSHVPPGLASCSCPASAAAVMVRWQPRGRVVSQGIDAVVREVKVAKDNGLFLSRGAAGRDDHASKARAAG